MHATPDACGGLYLGKTPITKDELPALLHSIFGSKDGDRVLYIRADKDAEYGVVLEAMTIVRRNGVAVVGMITERQSARVRR
jgi:biopolymer transport protein ExbD